MNNYYETDNLPKEPITFYMGTRKNREELFYKYDNWLCQNDKRPRYKKKYHLKREVWQVIGISIAFIGLMMIIAGIEMMVI